MKIIIVFVFVFVFVFIFAFIGCAEDKSPERGTDQKKVLDEKKVELREVEESVRKELGSIDPDWSSLDFLDSSEGSYRFAINYRKEVRAPNYRRVSQDTAKVVRATLKVLMDQGRDPREEWVTVYVHARQLAGKGETGAQLVRQLGRSSYNFNSDQIEFELP